MNSLVGLIAVSLLYIYLMRGSSWVYSVVLVMLVIPVAIVANIMRIMVLVLLTYFFGNEVAQGFLHVTAGTVPVRDGAPVRLLHRSHAHSFVGSRLSAEAGMTSRRDLIIGAACLVGGPERPTASRRIAA